MGGQSGNVIRFRPSLKKKDTRKIICRHCSKGRTSYWSLFSLPRQRQFKQRGAYFGFMVYGYRPLRQQAHGAAGHVASTVGKGERWVLVFTQLSPVYLLQDPRLWGGTGRVVYLPQLIKSRNPLTDMPNSGSPR